MGTPAEAVLKTELKRLKAENKRHVAEKKRHEAENRRHEDEKKRLRAEIEKRDVKIEKLSALRTQLQVMFGVVGDVMGMLEKADLKDLLRPGITGKELRARVHEIAILRHDDILADGKRVHQLTGYTLEEFRYRLDEFRKIIMRDKRHPLFRDDHLRTHDKGNRCKLRMEHLLLLVLMQSRSGAVQVSLGAIFNVDQGTASRDTNGSCS